MSEDASHHAFWADEIADQIEATEPSEPVVIKGGVSPSGVPHIGHLNEILRGYYVAAVLRERGYTVTQVFTADDRDPLRSVPRTLADAEGNLVDLGDTPNPGVVGRNLGRPYTDIPDPFECHDSYGDHFTALLADAADAVDVPVEFVSTTDLYIDGSLESSIRTFLDSHSAARDLVAAYQSSVDAEYVPFRPICANCGIVTDGVTTVDLDAGTVDYECRDIEAGEQVIEGCGHRGTASFREGKLPWRFEWPAQWAALDVDFEPFGKDHAEGSWDSGVDISESLLDREPPVPLMYEWFTLDGKALSSSSGHVATASDLLALIEPDVLRYFFALSPRKSRDLSTERIDQLVDQFDRFERLYFDEEGDSDLDAFADRAYPFVIDPEALPPGVSDSARSAGLLDERSLADHVYAGDFETVRSVLADVLIDRVRLPYTFAAVLGMTDDRQLRRDIATGEGHLPDNPPTWVRELALQRVPLARTWAEQEDNAYNYRLKAAVPEHDFSPAVRSALDELAAIAAEGPDGETLQAAIYETARDHDLDPATLFEAGYRLFFDNTQGPRLGEFLAELDATFVERRLRREG